MFTSATADLINRLQAWSFGQLSRQLLATNEPSIYTGEENTVYSSVMAGEWPIVVSAYGITHTNSHRFFDMRFIRRL